MVKSNRKRALFSLYDQDNVIQFAQQLVDLGWEIVATEETKNIVQENGIEVKSVSEFLGIKNVYPFPPTLHPQMELALTTNQGNAIDFVYDTTYPLSQGNDVGGHTLLALAAKGERIVVCDKNDMESVITNLRNNKSDIDPPFRQQLINKAYAKISEHYTLLINNREKVEALPMRQLLEGENPYQIPAYLFQTESDDPLALSNFEQVSGIPPCFTNMADFDAILQILCSLSEAFDNYYGKTPHIVIAAKHGNPCGLAVDWESAERAIENALWGNPRAIWGGEVITNFTISEVLARTLLESSMRKTVLGKSQWMLDIVCAPHFEKEAVHILGKRPERKLFQNASLGQVSPPRKLTTDRIVRGGFLRQPIPHYVLNLKECEIDFPFPDLEYVNSLIVAWVASWFSNHGGNEVAIAKGRRLLGVGGGPSTIDSCSTAVERAKRCGHDLANSVFAADAFFPFTDAPEELIGAGCIYGIVPDGGKNAELVKEYFKSNKVNVFYLPQQYRGFYRH
jgi:phosphoribosylaminoimidazolecarboxamide formyltransferase/IMP cyclohydrolase